MSPALLKKYLAAARLVADHVVLKPEGFVFAPHPGRDRHRPRQVLRPAHHRFLQAPHGRLRRLLPGRLEVSPSRPARPARRGAEPLRGRGGAEREVSGADLVGPDRGRGGSGAAGRRPEDVARTAGAGSGSGGRAPAANGCAIWSCACAGSSSPRSTSCTSRGFPTAASRSCCGATANWPAGIEAIRERFSPISQKLAEQLKGADAGLAKLFASRTPTPRPNGGCARPWSGSARCFPTPSSFPTAARISTPTRPARAGRSRPASTSCRGISATTSRCAN